jgi:hypothetical protein
MTPSEYKRGKNKDSFAKKQYFFSSFLKINPVSPFPAAGNIP